MQQRPRKSVKLFAECIVAPGFAAKALGNLRRKEKFALPRTAPERPRARRKELQLKRILGGMLVQQPDLGELKDSELRTVTKRAPHRRRNGHDCGSPGKSPSTSNPTPSSSPTESATLGVGAGQMSRVDSAKLAVMKATIAARQAASSPPTPSSHSPTASKKPPKPAPPPSFNPAAPCATTTSSPPPTASTCHGLHRHAPLPPLKKPPPPPKPPPPQTPPPKPNKTPPSNKPEQPPPTKQPHHNISSPP